MTVLHSQIYFTLEFEAMIFFFVATPHGVLGLFLAFHSEITLGAIWDAGD